MKETSLAIAGCKESQFYSLLFGQAAANMYLLKSHFNQAGKKTLMSGIDHSFL